MNPRFKTLIAALTLVCAGLLLNPVQAHPGSAALAAASAPKASAPVASAAASDPSAKAQANADADADADSHDGDSNDDSDDSNGRQLVEIGHDANLPAGQKAQEVVSVFGSSTTHGEVAEDVVSVFGDTQVTGKVGGDSVAVLGDNVVDGDVGGDVVAVLGHVKLGPNAHVHGELVDVLGSITRDPASQVDGGTQNVFPLLLPEVPGARNWFRHGLLLGRPLFLDSQAGFIWGIAAVLLALYVAIALLFHDAVDHCVTLLRRHPGRSLLTAVLACVITPLLLFLLLCTVIGIPAIPVVALGALCAALFGKAAALSWLGQRALAITRPAGAAEPPATALNTAMAVLIGGILVTVCYVVPVLGLMVFLVLGMLGYGAVIYALLERVRGPQPPAPAARATAQAAPLGVSAAATPSAASPGAGPEGVTASAPGAADPGAAAPAATAPATPLLALPRAGFWIRMGALFIDLVLVSVALDLLGSWHGDSGRLTVVVMALYGGLMWKLKGTTVGGIVCDLHVIREDGRDFDWSTAIVRALGCLLSTAVLGLGFIWIGVDRNRQAWHDKLAGTIVVRRPRGTPAP